MDVSVEDFPPKKVWVTAPWHGAQNFTGVGESWVLNMHVCISLDLHGGWHCSICKHRGLEAYRETVFITPIIENVLS